MVLPASALDRVVAAKTEEAVEMLRKSALLCRLAEQIALILSDTIGEGAPFDPVRLEAVDDPEEDWLELVFTIPLRGNLKDAWRWQLRIAEGEVELHRRLPEEERRFLARYVGVHVIPSEIQ